MTQSTEPSQPAPQRPRGLRGLLLGSAFAATFVVGGVAFSVVPAAAQMEMGMAIDHAGGHEAMRAMMMAHLDKALDAVGASPDQKARIDAILKSTMAQVMPLRAHMGGGHEELMRILTAPTIDRAALEQARAARMAEADQASKVMVAGLADAAEVLTPDQRAHLATLMEEHRHQHQEMQP